MCVCVCVGGGTLECSMVNAFRAPSDLQSNRAKSQDVKENEMLVLSSSNCLFL